MTDSLPRRPQSHSQGSGELTVSRDTLKYLLGLFVTELRRFSEMRSTNEDMSFEGYLYLELPLNGDRLGHDIDICVHGKQAFIRIDMEVDDE